MKKFLKIVSILIIISLCMSFREVYAATGQASLSTDSVQVNPGQTFTVTLSASCTEGINGISTKYNYDSNVLEFVEASPVDSTNWSDLSDVATNDITLLRSSGSTLIKTANLYNIVFRVKSTVSTNTTTNITTNSIFLSTFDSNDAEKTISAKTCTINVVLPKTVSSISMKTLPTKVVYVQKYGTFDKTGGVITVNYSDSTSEDISLSSSGVSVSGFSNTTAGTKTITVTYGGKSTTFSVNVLMLGDANLDNTVDFLDIFDVNKHRLNKVLLTGNKLLVSDVNNDSIIDIFDIFQINKYRLGKISSL